MSTLDRADGLLVAQRIEGGYSWTLASRLSNMLHRAEELYGARDLEYTPVGVEFTQDGPRTWYPGNRKHVAIQLSIGARYSVDVALFELAHEVIHLLSPSGGQNANVLEEGVSVEFALRYLREERGLTWQVPQPRYKRAHELVRVLLDIDEEAIKKLRTEQPFMPKISVEMILKHFPSVEQEIAENLSQSFNAE